MLIDLIVASSELYQRFLSAQTDFIILYSFNKTALSQSVEALQPIFEAICPLSNCDQDLIIPSRDRLLTLLVNIAVSNSTHPTIARSIVDWLKGICDDINHNTALVLKTIGVYPVLTMLSLWLLSEEKTPKVLSLENPSDVEVALRSSSRVPSPAVSKTAIGYDNRGNLLHSSANVAAKVKSLSTSFEATVRQEYQRKVADIEARSRLQLSCGLYLKQLITGTSGHESLSTTEIDSSMLCTPSGFTLAHFQTLLNFIQTCYTRLGQLEDQGGGSKAHTAVLQHIIKAKGSTKHPFSNSNPTLLKPAASPTTQMDKPESRLLTAIVITLDAVIGAAETALGPIVLSFMRALQANYTVWNLCMHLLGSPYGSIRYRAITLLTLSLSSPPHGLEPDIKALAFFEKPFNGFQVMVEQLSKHPSDDAIVQSLMSILYWRRSRSNPLKSQLSTGTLAAGSEVFAGLGLSGEVGISIPKSPLPADKTRVRESTLIKSPSLTQLEARGMVQSGISTAKDVIMRVKSSDSNTSGSAGDAKVKSAGDKTTKVASDSPEQSFLRSRTQSQTAGAQPSSLFSIFTWKSAAPPGKGGTTGSVDGDDLKDSTQFEGNITHDQSALSPVVDTTERRRSYSSTFHMPTAADNRRRASYEPRRDPPTEPSNSRVRPLSLDIHALPVDASSAEGSVTSAQGEQGVEYFDVEIIRVPQIFPALIAALQTCRSLDVVQSAVKTIVLSVDANVKSSRAINPTATARLSSNMDMLLLTCKDWIIHIAAAIQYKREKILGNKSVHSGDGDADGKPDSSSATSDVNGGDRLNSPRRMTHGESFSESHDNFISEASNTGISASEDELEESIPRSLYGDSAIDCSESVKSFTTRGGKHYSRHNTKPIDHLETLYNRFVEPFYLLIDVFIAIDMRKKPSPTRLCTEVFRLSVPEYEDIQRTILYNILKSLDNFPFSTQQYTTDIIIDYLKNYIYLLEQIFYKCDILLEFTVMTIKILYNINYKCLPDIRIRLKEIGIIDIKNIYIIQCLMDCFDSNSRDLYNRVIALCEINTSLQGYITSADTKTTTLMSNSHIILYILSIFIEAAEELEAVSVVESNFFHSDSNKELIEKVEMLINATYIIIAIIQSCVTFSQECKNVVRKLTKNVIGDNKDYLMTILLKSEPLSLPDFSTDATSGGGGGVGGGSVHGTGRETMSTLDMFMSSSFKRADSERSARSSSGDEEERVPTPTVPLYSTHAPSSSTPQSPTAGQVTSSWWGWSSASAPTAEITKVAATSTAPAPADPPTEPPPAPINPIQVPPDEPVKDATTIRANDIPDFLEWFCAPEQRRVFTEFKARVIKEIKPILKKMEKTYDRNIQRKVKHIKGEMDKLSKDRAASEKLLKEHKDKVQKHTDKAVIWYEQESIQHIEKVNMNLRQGKETLQSELESLRKRYTSTGGTSSCDSASQKGDDTTSSSEGPDSPHSTCPSPSPLPSQQSAPLLLKQIQQYFARGADSAPSTSSSTDSRASHTGSAGGNGGGVLTSSRDSKIHKTNDTNNTANTHRDDSQAVMRSSLTDKGAEKGSAVEKRENPLHIYEVVLAYMQQS